MFKLEFGFKKFLIAYYDTKTQFPFSIFVTDSL